MIDNIENYLSREALFHICSHYSVNNISEHEIRVGNFSMQLFDTLLPASQLNINLRSLLYYSALLHDIGYFVQKRGHHEHSKELILKDERFNKIPIELRFILGIMVRSHGKLLDHHIFFYPKDIQTLVIRLISILRIADALDHKHNLGIDVDTVLKDNELNLKLKGSNYEPIEKRLEKKAKLFKEVFPISIAVEGL